MTKKNYISGAAFRRWVARMNSEFNNNEEAMCYYYKGNTMYVYLRSKVGKARCNPSDKWNSDIGVAYAWARCTGQQEYYNIEDTYQPVAGDKVMVIFKNGDVRPMIFVAESCDNYCFRFLANDHLICFDKDRVKRIKVKN